MAQASEGRRRARITLGLTALLALAACGGGGGGSDDGDGNTVTPPPPPPAEKAFQDNFGGNFSADFNASATADPAEVSDGDVVPVNAMADPIEGNTN